jgi:hypothetical protein
VSSFANWDVTVHRRSTGLAMQGIHAHHGPGCEQPPDNTHANDSYEGAVFQCNNHIMTAVNDDSYGVIYLTPNQIVDFANGQEAVVRFDMSTLKTSSRDWVSIWISPYEEHLQLPLDLNVDLQGVPHNGILIDLTPELAFVPSIIRNGATVKYQFGAPGVNWWVGYDDFFTPSAAQRQTFELRLSQTHLKVLYACLQLLLDRYADPGTAHLESGHYPVCPPQLQPNQRQLRAHPVPGIGTILRLKTGFHLPLSKVIGGMWTARPA